jgi:hypothetical protein
MLNTYQIMNMRFPRVLVIFVALLISPVLANAATFLVRPSLSEVAPGSEVTFIVEFVAGENEINVVEGVLKVPETFTVQRMDTAGSRIALWQTKPTYDAQSREIIFTGGTPERMQGNDSALLFVVRGTSETEGELTLTPLNITGYLADGRGTPIQVSAEAMTVHVTSDPVSGQVPTEIPSSVPQPLIAEIGKDSALFEGKYFVSFFGGDTGEGVSYYEVKEGQEDAVRAEQYYVLKDQSLSSDIEVRAVFPDGHSVSVTIPAQKKFGITPIIVSIVFLFTLITLVLLYKKKRQRSTVLSS